MRCDKIISVVVVLAMIAVPFYVIGEIEASDDSVDTLSLDELISVTETEPNKYWIKATSDADGNVKLENNNTGTVDCYVKDDYFVNTPQLIIENNLTIPKNSAIDETPCNIKCNNKEIKAHGNLYVKALFDCTKITICGYLHLAYVENCENIIIDGGKFACSSFYNDQNINLKAVNNAVIDYLDVNGRFDFGDIKTNDSENGLTINYNKDNKTVKLSGTAIGIDDGCIRLYEAVMEIDNLKLNNVCLNLEDIYDDSLIVLCNDFVLYNTGSYILLPYDGLTFDKIVSKSGEVLLASFVKYSDYWYTNNPITDSEYSFYSFTIDADGIKDARTTLLFLTDNGVEKINLTSEYGNVMFVNVNEKINLNEIKVDCSKGYVFDGWYTINDFGYEEKVQTPDNFATNTSTVLIAKAIPAPYDPPVTPEQKDYTVYFIVIIAMIVILALLALLYYLRCEGILFAKK